MALRLRYRDRIVVLSTGQLVVGRSMECNLVVNDPLASRKHAVITTGKTGSFVKDLGSKAGVQVNGTPISGERRLATGDVLQLAGVRIAIEDVDAPGEPADPKLRTTLSPPASEAPRLRQIATPARGFQQVSGPSRVERIYDDEDLEPSAVTRTHEAPSEATSQLLRDLVPAHEGPRVDTLPEPLDLARAPAARRAEPPPPLVPPTRPAHAPRAEPPSPPVDLTRTQDAPRVVLPPDVANITRPPPLPSFARPDNLRAVATLAEKAFALNRAEEAERILQRAMLDAVDAARRGELDGPGAELAATLAGRLACALGTGRWFDVAVEIYGARSEIMPGAVIDLLMSAARKAKPIDKVAFRKYLAAARGAAGDSPARRFLFQRLEGVQRILDLK